VFVTHDQGEALSMADASPFSMKGKIVQVGTPAEVYQRPESRFVADFLGSSNLLPPPSLQAMAAWLNGRCLRPRNGSASCPDGAQGAGRA